MFRGIRVFSLVSAAAILSACGGATVPITKKTSSTSNVSSTSTSSINLGTGSNGTPAPTSSTTPTTPTGTNPPLTMRVGTVGYNATTVQVSTGTILKVKFTPGIQDTAIAGTGVYPQYSQLGVYITVNGYTVPTQMLNNGRYTGQAQTSSALDFSAAIASACGSNKTCRQNVTITIDHPNDDYWCLNYGQYCPWSYVYDTHPWHGTLTIETDDTVAI